MGDKNEQSLRDAPSAQELAALLRELVDSAPNTTFAACFGHDYGTVSFPRFHAALDAARAALSKARGDTQ